MLRSLYSGISGMHNFQTKLDVIGNNIANVNTSGFKAGRAEFADIMSQTMQGATAPTGTSTAAPATATTPSETYGGMNPRQIGLGSKVASIDTIFTDGSTQTTNVPTDLAISGKGFFVLKDSANNLKYTRNGHFTLDSNGYLVADNGAQVMQVTTTPGTPPTITTKAIQVPLNAQSFSIDGNGNVNYIDSTGALASAGQISLATFTNPGGLTKEGDTTFSASTNSGTPAYGNANNAGYGGITVGALEMSNVDLSNEFTEMIVAQRAFQANTRIITVSDSILQELVDMKRN